MRRKVKVASLSLVAVMLMSMLAACSSTKNEGGSASSITPTSSVSTDKATKDPYEITMAIPIFGAVPKDVEAVQAEINKISQAKINATVKILPISIGAWQQQMNLITSGGEKLDLAISFGASYGSAATTGKIVPIDDLLSKYGQGIQQAVAPEYLKSAQVGGKIYGTPNIKNYGGRTGIIMRKDLVEKYKIDVASIKTLDDVEKVLKTIKEGEPTIAPLASGLSPLLESYQTYDKLGDRFGVLPGFDNGLKVENYFESKEYEDLLKRMNSWFKSGYINKDAATTQTNEFDLMKANKAFAYIAKYKPGFVEQEMRKTGKEMVWADLLPAAYATTDDVLNALWTISKNSGNPERAMMFLNLMYSDKNITNLLLWGIEGKHYVKVSDNVIDYPSGVDAKTVGYSNQNWIIGNSFLTYPFKTDDPDLWNKTKAFNEQAIKSKALGFSFNSEQVKNEITALNNVLEQYRKALETGAVDPTDKLQEFRSKLKAAGMDKVIAEKQKQLDAWAAANKK
ncbi:ABC transporter substrate-binding protein [Paenibacillus sp. V4I7]|uniref:ABC transporter substrate-binding protein n=1 Tax=Paenibacillus sp. V4I7 TaxID=3042307 RepID=UPI002781DD01|nr:ABC transporter substrate-binding protein [Paenibacillus sp. V4I7]MDQ0897724.1 putative aldouronate transport system substrate-binding protein [Paenibacillus sp. V4I7]